jgi:hypothetical protein
MKRPSFQFYPADWRSDSKLRRCSEAARGAWVDVLCVLHDSDDSYGLVRWRLGELIRVAGVSAKSARELVAKGVLRGADTGAEPFVFTPTHAGKKGAPVTLIEADSGPVWYSSRMVRDEYVRQQRGRYTRFEAEPKPTPKPGYGAGLGDGPSSTSSSSKRAKEKAHSATAEPNARFLEFWTAYPRSDAKKDAVKIWARKGFDAIADTIIADVRRRLTDGSWADPKFVPYASTYLNGERWSDGPPSAAAGADVPDFMRGAV